ncbi:P-loop containing nucleoside triphosphate hydrolase protein [Ramicandelaber brevisporus]|nr:P-loop containing nucleoside triphosphate hydrolase protein [Ramicandelaber brevisporus]
MTATTIAAPNVAKGRGAFIVFEGSDRSALTTQRDRLVSALKARGIRADSISFVDRPIRAPRFKKRDIRSQSSVDRWKSMGTFKRKLNDGITIVVDRYSYSDIAYSVAKGLEMEWCVNGDKGLFRPDLTLFIDNGDVPNAQERDGLENGRNETVTIQTKMNEVFAAIKQEDWIVVDARDSIENIAAKVEEMALETIEKCADLPIREDLWMNNSATNQAQAD